MYCARKSQNIEYCICRSLEIRMLTVFTMENAMHVEVWYQVTLWQWLKLTMQRLQCSY